MDNHSARISTVCKSIEQCFSYYIFTTEFTALLTEEDLQMGAGRDFDLISNATLLVSALSLRKLDDFFLENGREDDLKATNFEIDAKAILERENFLEPKIEREMINKCVAHLTDQLFLDDDFEVDLNSILLRSIKILQRLSQSLRAVDKTGDAKHSLDQTDTTLKRVEEWFRQEPKEEAPRETVAGTTAEP